jgi:DNA-nicking Smr family endonuclease
VTRLASLVRLAYPGGVKLVLDLHDIYNHGSEIDRALQRVFDEAAAKKAPVIEIIPGKGSGQLKKHVLRFLERKDIKPLYHRVEKDSKNFGRLFVHFRWK